MRAFPPLKPARVGFYRLDGFFGVHSPSPRPDPPDGLSYAHAGAGRARGRGPAETTGAPANLGSQGSGPPGVGGEGWN